MNDNGDVAEITKTPGNPMREPENDARQEQQDSAPEETPEKELLARVEASDRRHLIVLVANIVGKRTHPLVVFFR
jgi:hypothetical protein